MTTTASTAVRAGRRTLRLNRPDKVLFPDDGYTKADLVAYYRDIAPYMLPELRGRPVMMERHPDGIRGPRFLQKEAPDYYAHRREAARAMAAPARKAAAPTTP